MEPTTNKRESITITRGAYDLLVARKNMLNDKGIPASLGAIASESIVNQIGSDNGRKEEE